MIPMADGKVVGPFERPSDVNVIMTTVHPQPIKRLGNLVILNKVAQPATLAKKTDVAKTPKQKTIETNLLDVKLATDPSKSKDDTQKTEPKASGSQGKDDKSKSQDSTPKESGSQNSVPSGNESQVTKPNPGTQVTQPTQTNNDDKGSTSIGRAFSNELSNTDRMNGILLRKVDTDTGALYREYKNIDAVSVDYDTDTAVYKKAAAYFAQSNHSDRIAVLDYVDGKLEDSLKDFWTFNWTLAIFGTNKLDDETVLASNIFEANQDHFLVLQSNDLAEFNKYYGQNYTIGLKHDLTEPMDSAFVGAIANLEVGSATWKFKKLEGITPDQVTVQERSGIDTAHAIAYIISDGMPETSEGFTMSGEYIDVLHGEIWTKTKMSSALVELLHKNPKITYGPTGIGMIRSTVEGVLLQAFNKGIIAERGETGKGEYSVTATPREEQSAEDLSKRHYGGVSFTYHASSAIHTVTINGTVQSDTILS